MVLRLAQGRDLQSHSWVSGERGAGDGTAPSPGVRSAAGRGFWTEGHQAGASIPLCGPRHVLCSRLWPPSAYPTVGGELLGPGHRGPCREKMARGQEHRRECRQDHRQQWAPPEQQSRFRPPLQLGLLSFLALLPADPPPHAHPE